MSFPSSCSLSCIFCSELTATEQVWSASVTMMTAGNEEPAVIRRPGRAGECLFQKATKMDISSFAESWYSLSQIIWASKFLCNYLQMTKCYKNLLISLNSMYLILLPLRKDIFLKYMKRRNNSSIYSVTSSVQLLSHVQLFATPWTAAHQASLSITNSRSPPKPMSIESIMDTTISSSVIPFSSCPQSFPASGSFQMSQLFALGGQSIGVSASTSVLPMNIQD